MRNMEDIKNYTIVVNILNKFIANKFFKYNCNLSRLIHPLTNWLSTECYVECKILEIITYNYNNKG